MKTHPSIVTAKALGEQHSLVAYQPMDIDAEVNGLILLGSGFSAKLQEFCRRFEHLQSVLVLDSDYAAIKTCVAGTQPQFSTFFSLSIDPKAICLDVIDFLLSQEFGLENVVLYLPEESPEDLSDLNKKRFDPIYDCLYHGGRHFGLSQGAAEDWGCYLAENQLFYYALLFLRTVDTIEAQEMVFQCLLEIEAFEAAAEWISNHRHIGSMSEINSLITERPYYTVPNLGHFQNKALAAELRVMGDVPYAIVRDFQWYCGRSGMFQKAPYVLSYKNFSELLDDDQLPQSFMQIRRLSNKIHEDHTSSIVIPRLRPYLPLMLVKPILKDLAQERRDIFIIEKDLNHVRALFQGLDLALFFDNPHVFWFLGPSAEEDFKAFLESHPQQNILFLD